MRTTLTLDEDVAAKLQAEMRRTGRSFRDTVNGVLRLGLASRPRSKKGQAFKVTPRDLGELRPGLSLDNVGELLEVVEGPLHP
jgi:hypothetical protein